MNEILFRSGNETLQGFMFNEGHVSNRQCGILFVHGSGSSQTGYARRATAISHSLSAICLTFDLRGHGAGSCDFSKYSAEDHLHDLEGAYDQLISLNNVDPARIGVCGASYGGYLAALLTATRPVKRLILRAPSLEKASENGRMGRLAGESKVNMDSLKAIRSFEGETLVTESEKDEVISKAVIAAYAGASVRGKRELIPDATHALTNPVWDDRFISLIETWFQAL